MRVNEPVQWSFDLTPFDLTLFQSESGREPSVFNVVESAVDSPHIGQTPVIPAFCYHGIDGRPQFGKRIGRCA